MADAASLGTKIGTCWAGWLTAEERGQWLLGFSRAPYGGCQANPSGDAATGVEARSSVAGS